MAKLQRGAKSQAIRDYLTNAPNAMPKDVVAALKEKGIKVSSQMVSTLKAKGSGGKKKRGRKKGSAASRNGSMVALETLMRAKKLADQLGGIEKAKQAMDALAKLQQLVMSQIASLALLLSVLSADPDKPFTSPKPSPPEYGYSLSAQDARDGWICLFDGKSTFGWRDARLEDSALVAGQTTTTFAGCDLRAEAVTAGKLSLGNRTFAAPAGMLRQTLREVAAGPISLGKGISLKSLAIRPLGLAQKFNGKDLSGWKVIPHSQLAADKQAKWSVEEEAIHAFGGPGALELAGLYGDLVLQIEVRTRTKLANGGVFVRAMPGVFLNGYEAQVFNGCYEEDPGQPARYSTGAIDDRQLARRLVSRDLEPFTMTIVAHGPHLATWVNGQQMTDWTDERKEHENPREGLRLAPGAIQLQAHDPATDIEFRSVRVAEIK